MSPPTRLFDPLRRAWRALFVQDLRLQRREDGLALVLEERHPTARPKSREQQARERENAELDRMRQELAAVLDAQPETRDTLRHLVFVEQALARKGLRALHKVPLPVLQRALVQLEGLVTNWSAEGLAALRSKMAVAVIDREAHDPEAEADAYRTAAVLDTPTARAASEAAQRAAARRRADEHAETAPMVLRVEVPAAHRPPADEVLMQTGGELSSRPRGSRPRSSRDDFQPSAPIPLRPL